MSIVCKSAAEIEKMRKSGRVVRQVLDYVRTLVKPCVTTMDLERAAEQKMKDLGVKPAFKGYYDYPCVLCTSINEEIVHGIPSEKRVLKAGDIVSIDCGVVLDGYYGDAAITVPVDETIAPELKKLLEVTEASLQKGIQQVLIGNSVGDVGAAVRVCGSQRLQRSARVCRPWHWDAASRRAASSELRDARTRCEVARRHGPRNRAHGEFWQGRHSRLR